MLVWPVDLEKILYAGEMFDQGSHYSSEYILVWLVWIWWGRYAGERFRGSRWSSGEYLSLGCTLLAGGRRGAVTSGLGPTPQPVQHINYHTSWLRLNQGSKEPVEVNKFWHKELSNSVFKLFSWSGFDCVVRVSQSCSCCSTQAGCSIDAHLKSLPGFWTLLKIALENLSEGPMISN